MQTPASVPVARPWSAARVVRVIAGWLLVASGGGLALVMIVGFALHPDALARTLGNEPGAAPTWPFQVGWVLVNLAIAAVGLRLALVTPRPGRVSATAPSDPAAATPIRTRDRAVVPRPAWTWSAVLRVAIAVVLFPAGAFVVIAAIGLLATSGWDYLWSDSPAGGFNSTNAEAIVTLGTIGAMMLIGAWTLFTDRFR